MKDGSLHPFLKRYLLTVPLTFLGLGLLLSAFLLYINETGPFGLKKVVDGENVLWGSAFEQKSGFKLERIRRLHPDLLVVGSSRATQFRAEMFPGVSFYNAALAVTSFPEARTFFEWLLSLYRPKVVLLTVDPWWFNPARGMGAEEKLNDGVDSFLWRPFIANALRGLSNLTLMKEVWHLPAQRDQDTLGKRSPQGFGATFKASGFRPDGSFQYGNILMNMEKRYYQAGYGWQDDFKYFRNEVSASRGRFAYTGTFDAGPSDTLRAVLSSLKEAGVVVIVVLPPFPTGLIDEIKRTPMQREFFAQFERKTEEISREMGAEFHNCHDLGKLGISDRQTIDGLHVDEISTAALMLDLVPRSPSLSTLLSSSGMEELRRRLADRASWPHQNILFP